MRSMRRVRSALSMRSMVVIVLAGALSIGFHDPDRTARLCRNHVGRYGFELHMERRDDGEPETQSSERHLFRRGFRLRTRRSVGGRHVRRPKALDHPLAEHWDGTDWSRVSVPQPTGQQAVFHGVVDLAPYDAWAVGTSFSGGVGATPAGLTLIEHWNGTVWSIVPSPNPATGIAGDSDVLEAISGTGTDDVWAAGWDNNEETGTIALLFEHWNGTVWKAATSPTPLGSFQFAFGITAVSLDDVWAVGSDETGQPVTLAANWNGKTWAIVPTPDYNGGPVAQNELTGVSGTGPDNVWASGFANNVNDKNLSAPYVLHWSGKSWTLTKVPDPNSTKEGSRLNGIQALSSKDAWAVGQTQKNNGSILSLTEQYNGSTWAVVPSPDPGMLENLVDNSLDSVGSAGAGNLFSVGADEMTGQCCLRTLAIGTNQG